MISGKNLIKYIEIGKENIKRDQFRPSLNLKTKSFPKLKRVAAQMKPLGRELTASSVTNLVWIRTWMKNWEKSF